MPSNRFRSATRAFGWHLLISAAVSALAAGIVFGILYPPPYAQMLGGFELFLILVGVDVVCGPLLTLVLFNPAKPRKELVLDLSLVVGLQVGALAYGLHTVWHARPVYLIFDVDRFQVVTLADIDPEEMRKKPDSIPNPQPLSGPVLLSSKTAQPEDSDYLENIEKSLMGNDAFLRADRWRRYDLFTTEVLSRSNSTDLLYAKHPDQKKLLDDALLSVGRAPTQVVWFPVLSRRGSGWTLILDAETAKPLKFVPLEGF